MNWKNERVLVTGHNGMIGKELYEMLLEICGDELFGIDKNYCELGKNCNNPKCGDLTYKEMCEKYMEYVKPTVVFHLAGIKGNPKMTNERPVDFMGPMLQFDTNMILAAQKYGVKRFLYTSSIAVENPESDKYPAWAKKTAETLIEAIRIQYPNGTKYCIVRPSNVYGNDSFDNPYAMVMTSLITKAIINKQITLDKKGSEQIRDIIYSKDVARNMIKVMEEMPDYPVNLCSGKETSIKQIAEIISKELDVPIEYKDLNLTLGPNKKVMKQNYPLIIKYDLNQGIKETIEYAKKVL